MSVRLNSESWPDTQYVWLPSQLLTTDCRLPGGVKVQQSSTQKVLEEDIGSEEERKRWGGARPKGRVPGQNVKKEAKAAAGRGRGAVNDARDVGREKYSERL